MAAVSTTATMQPTIKTLDPSDDDIHRDSPSPNFENERPVLSSSFSIQNVLKKERDSISPNVFSTEKLMENIEHSPRSSSPRFDEDHSNTSFRQDVDDASCCSDDTVLSVGNEAQSFEPRPTQNLTSFKHIQTHLNAISQLSQNLNINPPLLLRPNPINPNPLMFLNQQVLFPIEKPVARPIPFYKGFEQFNQKTDESQLNQNLKFSIDNILKADFGRRITDPLTKRKSLKRTIPPKPKEVIDDSRVQEKGPDKGAIDLSKGEDSQGSANSGDGNMVWPAWVYCTRYSDRPSSDIIEESPQRSPVKLKKVSSGKQKTYGAARSRRCLQFDRLPLSEPEALFDNDKAPLESNDHHDLPYEETTEMSIEAPSFTPLTLLPAYANQSYSDASVRHITEDSYVTRIESLECSIKKSSQLSLTPRTPKLLFDRKPLPETECLFANDEVPFVSHERNDLPYEEPAEMSIEAPPFSPLTPAPAYANIISLGISEDNSVDCPIEKSNQPLILTPQTPKPLPKLLRLHAKTSYKKCVRKTSNDTCFIDDVVKQNQWATADKNNDSSLLKPQASASPNSPLSFPFSPLPSMSPSTLTLFNLLANSLDTEENNTCENNTDSPSSNHNNHLNSDDLVRDPDYVADDGDSDTSESISEKSPLTFTTIVQVDSQPDPVVQVQNRKKTLTQKQDFNTASASNIDEANEDDAIIPWESDCDIEDNEENVRPPEPAKKQSGRPKKGRKRKYGGLNRAERKKKKYSNCGYINTVKKYVAPKEFIDVNCACKNKCHEKIPSDQRLAEFDKLYALGSYEAQSLFIAACVKEEKVKRHYVSKHVVKISKEKHFYRNYSIQGVSVCKEMFRQTFQISSNRINTALSKMRSQNNIKDNRGCLVGGRNKIPDEKEQVLIDLINRIPVYVSHYRRENNNDAKYLGPDMTFAKIYELYCEETKSKGDVPMSFSKAYSVFVSKFNLRTKPLKKDTCNKCDYYNSLNTQALTEEEKIQNEQSHQIHLKKASELQERLKSDMKLAKDDPTIECLTFDLQKTLPLPRIPTNVVFYKRQLWVYNLGIHSGSKDEAHCNVWVEGEAGRGAQEVGSCLLKHILNRLDKEVTQLILWSDSCGGQNRNIKLTLMLIALLRNHETLQTISIRFLESGHSFLPNDTDFGKIECELKHQQRLYTPDDYMKVMEICKKKNPMQVHRMQKEDFFSTENLEKNITNRKKAIDGSKISWLNTKEILLKKDHNFSIFMRNDLNENYTEVSLKKKVRHRQETPLSTELLVPLWPNGKAIPEAKLKDLKSLLHLIPMNDQQFYTQIIGDDKVQDDVDGFSGLPDFNIECDDNEDVEEADDD